MSTYRPMLAATVALCLLGAFGALAQTGQPSPAIDASGGPDLAAPFNASTDSLTSLVAYRSESEIMSDLESAAIEKMQAEQKYERAKMMATLAEARIKLKESEIKGFEAQIDFAKTEKNELNRAEYGARKVYAEAEKKLLEKRRDLRKREIEVAKALREYHEEAENAARFERDLAVRRQQRAGFGNVVNPAVANDFMRLQAEITSLESKVLDAQIKQADKWKSVADQEVQLVKIRKKVFQSQVKVMRVGR